MKKFALFTTLLLCTSVGFGEDLSSRDLRSDSTIGANVHFSLSSLPMPGNKGAYVYYIANAKWTLGLDYNKADIPIKFFKINLGEVAETHLTMQARRFIGNSFNVIMGAGTRNLEVRLPSNLLDLALKDYNEIATQVETRFVRLGVGNQWQWNRGYTLAVDWLTLNIPVNGQVIESASKYASDKDNKEKILFMERSAAWYPSGTLLQLNAGFIW